MKKLILAAAAIMVSVAAFGQGQVVFNNRVIPDVDARVTFVTTGAGVGAGYFAQLFGGAAGTASANLTALTPTATFRTSSAASMGYLTPPADAVTVPGVAIGSSAALQMRVFTTGGTAVGQSTVFSVTLGGGTLPPANLIGLTAFTVTSAGGPIVPEPATMALAALGGAAMLLLRRRK